MRVGRAALALIGRQFAIDWFAWGAWVAAALAVSDLSHWLY